MIKYFALLAVLRFAVQNMSDTYETSTERCRFLLKKAQGATIESVRSAYCVEVVEADHMATSETLAQYKLGFLASNETYSTSEQVLAYSCRIPSWVETLLVWTAGIGPLTFVWILRLILQKFMVKKLAHPVAPRPKAPTSLDKPPRFPKRNETYTRNLYKAGDRQNKPRDIELKTLKKTADAIIGTFGKVSPALRKRIMGTEP